MIKVPANIVDDIANAFGTRSSELSYLGGGMEFSDGIVYSFVKDGRPYALKILGLEGDKSEKGLKEISERLKFVHFCGEQGVKIVHPIANAEGRIYEQRAFDNKLFIAYIMDKVEGQPLNDVCYDDKFIANIGRTAGQMHKAAKLYPMWKGEGPDGDCEVLGWKQEVEFFIGWCADEDVKASWKEMNKRLETLDRNRATYGFLHNDMHLGNMIINGDDIHLLDFDVANFHWFANDIVCSTQNFLWSKSGGFDRPLNDKDALKRFMESYLDGYEKETHIDGATLENLDLFLNYRRMIIFTAMQDYMNSNPKVKEANKRMIRESPEVFRGIFG